MAEIHVKQNHASGHYVEQLKGTLMVFSKWRFFLLIFSSMLIGIGFFFIGYWFGYQGGRSRAIAITAQALNDPDHAVPELHSTIELAKMRQEKKWIQENAANQSAKQVADVANKYMVHVGLFTEIDYAKQAWRAAQKYSRLDDKEAITKSTLGGKDLYRVIIGKFTTKEEAQAFARNILDSGDDTLYPVVADYSKHMDTFGADNNPQPVTENKSQSK